MPIIILYDTCMVMGIMCFYLLRCCRLIVYTDIYIYSNVLVHYVCVPGSQEHINLSLWLGVISCLSVEHCGIVQHQQRQCVNRSTLRSVTLLDIGTVLGTLHAVFVN